MVKLYGFFSSSASYRARIALNLKGVEYASVSVDLRAEAQHEPAYRSLNPQGRVPALVLDDGTVIAQSLAIIDYLETTRPEPPLHPSDPELRARAMAVALTIATDIHPLNNTSVLNYLRDRLGQDRAARDGWYAHWITVGFAAIEELIDGGDHCFGDRPTIADVVLVPQVFNARRYNVDIGAFPKILRADAHLTTLAAFAKAHPGAQPDAN